MKLNFNLRNSSGKKMTTINLIINYDKKRYKYQLNNPLGIGYKIHPHNWNPKTKKPKAKGQIRPISEVNNIELINNVINELNYKLPIQINKYLQEYGTIDNIALKTMCDEILNSNENVAVEESEDNEGCIYDYMNTLIQNMEKGKKLKPDTTKYGKGTIKQYRNLRDRLNEFSKNLKFDDINKELYDEFIYYLNENNYAISTIGKFVKDFKSVLSFANMDGASENKSFLERWFIKPKPRTELFERTDVTLSIEEVEKIYNLQLNGKNEYLDKYRDVFLIGVFTGLRVGDYSNIKREMIKEDIDGYYIELLSQKSKNNMTIPIVDDRLLNILEKYDFNPPNLFEQKINDYIKVICDIADIKDNIVYYEQRGGGITEHKEPKNLLVTSHTARRTFITTKLLEGWSYSQIKEFTGHKTDEMLRKYDKATPRQKQLAFLKKMR